jgi:amino acid transporter
VAAINFRGISESVKLNLGLTAIELSGLLLVVAIGSRSCSTAGASRRGRSSSERRGGPLAILGGAALAFLRADRLRGLRQRAEETKEPSTFYPRALFGGLLVAG